jgi:hypothetical protein
MSSSRTEDAIINFYCWDYKYRGYYLFPAPVDILPPYQPFSHPVGSHKKIDDGRVPNIFQQIGSLFEPKVEVDQESEDEPEPNYLSPEKVPELKACRLIFQLDSEINSLRNIEFINMLSYSESIFSFEIIAQQHNISFQFVSTSADFLRLISYLKAYFPEAILQEVDAKDLSLNGFSNIAIADFGLSEEFVRPIKHTESLSLDPLTSLIASLDGLDANETIVLQIIFKGINVPLAHDIHNALSDGAGGSFFVDAPEMKYCAEQKTESPLFSVVMRMAIQGQHDYRTRLLSKEVARSITSISTSQYNKLIPLSNTDYPYDFHEYNLYNRLSNRLGFVLNSKELNTFIHYPNKTIVNTKIGFSGAKTKAPKQLINFGTLLGVNHDNGKVTEVRLSHEQRLSHTHILGVTGVGKSTLIANMVLNDAHQNLGCTILDPHGDIIDDILKRIPEHRKDDVIFLDPSDTDFPVGFNLLEAKTEAEKIVLSSDIVNSFKRHATAWGDNMTSVLQNAVNTILESAQGATLIELKRFLIEEKFRHIFLDNVDDPSLHYYWKHEYPMLRKGITPLLTRLDTFLRPKIIRYMLAQKSGINFKECIEQRKMVLIKLSQGLIGEQNSYLLGSLYLSKINQAVMSRQNLPKKRRHPYFLYCDEFHHFMTPSINNILGSARKYGLGLTLAHQELSQIDDPKLLNSVLSNPLSRICFRIGDNDAKRLAPGFSYFEADDLTSLSRGEAIIRIGESNNDFNLKTSKLEKALSSKITDYIISQTRNKYASTKAELENILISMLPNPQKAKKDYNTPKQEIEPKDKTTESKKGESSEAPNEVLPTEEPKPSTTSKNVTDTLRNKLIEEESASLEIRAHTYLKSLIKKLGQDRNFIAYPEFETDDGGRIDMVLERDNVKISFEISETNSPQYEVQNIKKCLRQGCIPVIMVSKHKHHLNNIEKLARQELSENDLSLIEFLLPDDIPKLLDGLTTKPQKNVEVIKGYRIVTEIDSEEDTSMKNIKSQLARLFRRKK